MLQNGPTYRCLYPEPPPPETVTNCSDGGVLGVVPGVIGVLQALETIKVLTGVGQVLSGKLLLFDGLSGSFRTIKLRGRKDEEVAKIKALIDYEQFCGAGADDKDQPVRLLEPSERISVQELDQMLSGQDDTTKDFVLVDVRTRPELDICALPKSVNVPMADLTKASGLDQVRLSLESGQTRTVIALCRRGNDSQKAVRLLKDLLPSSIQVKDVQGGLYAWQKHINHDFPIY